MYNDNNRLFYSILFHVQWPGSTETISYYTDHFISYIMWKGFISASYKEKYFKTCFLMWSDDIAIIKE